MLSPPEIVARVAASLRAVRRARELSQHDLGDLAGVTASAISQVERAERGLSLATLVRLSGALGVTIDDLLRGEEPGGYRIGRRTDDPQRGLDHTLTLLDDAADLHIDLVHLDAREAGEPDARARAAPAIVAVASGLVQVQIAGQTPALRHGEVLVADSEQIDGWRNLGQAEAVLFWIVFESQPYQRAKTNPRDGRQRAVARTRPALGPWWYDRDRHTPPLAPELRGPLKRVPAEALVFAAATELALVHALDDAVRPSPARRRPSIAMRSPLGLALNLGIAAILLFARMRAGLRAGVAFAFGGLAVDQRRAARDPRRQPRHDRQRRDRRPRRRGRTGARRARRVHPVAPPRRPRTGAPAPSPCRRRSSPWRSCWCPTGMAIVEVHKWREAVGAAPSAAYQDVTFRSTDGLKLAGWYRPSTNGASIIVAHGGGSDRRGAVAHASMLARHGYGVLLYDARGRGESEGDPNSYAWGWEKDANGAVAFLKRQPDVRDGRIGGLGLSSGADALVDVAATNPDLRATIGDGTALRTFEDAKRLGGGTVVDGAAAWSMFKAIEVIGGQAPPVALEDRISRITSPLLLISSGRLAEYDFNALYMKSAQPTTQHWNMPDGHHTRGLREYPAEYEQRVTALLRSVLGRVAVVQAERIAVRVREERLVADAGVHDVAAERDALGLEALSGRGDVVDLERDHRAARPELEPERVRLHDREREVAGLELGGRHVAPLLDERQAERLAVELRGAVVVLHLDGDEVDAGDE